MEDSRCKISENYKTHGCKIIGFILIALATILTLITLSSLGILGMFIVGAIFCCHKYCHKYMGNCCHCCPTTTTYHDATCGVAHEVDDTKKL